MSTSTKHSRTPERSLAALDNAREAITYFRPLDDREAELAPLSIALIRRIFTYTRPYKQRRNWLFVLTLVRGLQLPALAWMIGLTINGPIAGRDLSGIWMYSAIYLVLVLAMIITLHFRQRFALELGEAVAVWVRLRAGAAATEDDIRAFCRGRVAHFKIPQYIRFVDGFPMTVSGKVQKFRMREREIQERNLQTVATA